MKKASIFILTTALIFVVVFAVIAMCEMDYHTNRIQNVPAQYFEVNEIVNEDYQIIATDKRNIVWLRKYNDDSTYYIATVSGDRYLNSSFFEKFTVILKTNYKEYLEIEIEEQGKMEVLKNETAIN